jgi:hypothetical protein
MSNTVSWERRGCFIAYSDHVTFSEFFGAIIAIHADENYNQVAFVIHDMTRVTTFDFSDVNMIKIASHELGARFTNPNVRPAVVSTNPTMIEMTKVFSELTKLQVGIFPTVTEARAWIIQTQVPA